MSNDSDHTDALADVAVGETVTMQADHEVYLYGLNRDSESWIGHDKRIEEYRVVEQEIDGHDLHLTVEADVTKIDPKVKPAFNTKESWERYQARQADPSPAESGLLWALRAHRMIPDAAITAGVTVLVGTVAWFLMRDIALTVNGETVGMLGIGAFLPVLALIVVLVSVLDYALRNWLAGAKL